MAALHRAVSAATRVLFAAARSPASIAAWTFFTAVFTEDLMDLFLSALLADVRILFFADLMFANFLSSNNVLIDRLTHRFPTTGLPGSRANVFRRDTCAHVGIEVWTRTVQCKHALIFYDIRGGMSSGNARDFSSLLKVRFQNDTIRNVLNQYSCLSSPEVLCLYPIALISAISAL